MNGRDRAQWDPTVTAEKKAEEEMEENCGDDVQGNSCKQKGPGGSP